MGTVKESEEQEMLTRYVACVSGELEYKRWSLDNIEHLIWAINKFQESKYDKKLVIKKYEVEHECDTCVDSLGKDIVVLEK